MESIRVIIADDHPIFRYGLRALLLTEPLIEVVGEARTGKESIELAALLDPEVILMDLSMPGDINGIEATRRILTDQPHIKILIVTMSEDDDSVFAAMQAGARGYLLKGTQVEETIQAIQIVHQGEAMLSPSIARRVMQFFGSTSPATSRAQQKTEVLPELSPREREVLRLIAGGYTNQRIAEDLVLSPHTVRHHISSIFSKLAVASRNEAIIRAREAGLMKDEQ
ncbi:MAG: response regulator transcription factor [Ktedonobacteraceae bacterium]|nr:response regulator transcription factor [Ktedonobacteraceae bacterium]